MEGLIETRRAPRAVPLLAVDAKHSGALRADLGKNAARWCEAAGFTAEPGNFCLIPDAQGQLRSVLVGVSRPDDVFALAALPYRLPVGNYRLDTRGVALDPVRAAIGWGMGAYSFVRYRKGRRAPSKLAVDAALMRAVEAPLNALYKVRDLVNTPTEDLGPAELSGEVRRIAEAYGAKFHESVGDQLLKANFPTIHAVGRASHRPPRLVELKAGNAKHPHVVLIGKGVCFDTGGLDIKTSDGMRWMKKDMGGAAHAIALAEWILAVKLPIRLTLLIPAVENSIGGNAYRPGEVIRTRAGLTVEVDNTDAEGRLVLCDALAYAAEQKPDLIVDFSTLTGAARVALGPDLPALFANDDRLAQQLLAAGEKEQDALWRMPLWQPYRSMLDSRIADMVNCPPSRHAGAITAALYLQRFVPDSLPWLHLDMYAWNESDRPGKPAGGEAQSLRAVFRFLSERYASKP